MTLCVRDWLADLPLHINVMKDMGHINPLGNRPWGTSWENQMPTENSSLKPLTPSPSPYHCSSIVVSKAKGLSAAKRQPGRIPAFSDHTEVLSLVVGK